MNSHRSLLTSAVLSLTAAAVSGCASTTGNSGAAPASSAGSTATAASTVASTVASKSVAVAECRNADLAINSKSGGAAGGHVALLVTFANQSAHRCSLQGFPKASLLDASGKVVAQAQDVLNGFMGVAFDDANLTAPPHVVVDPGRSVMAVVEWGDVDPDQAVPGGCLVKSSSDVLVTAPGSTVAARLPGVAYVCEAFQVNPVIGKAPK